MNYLSYRIKLYKLNRKRDKEDKSLSKKIEETRKKGGYDAANKIYQTEGVDLQLIDEEISLLATQYFIQKARKDLLPIPSMNDKDGLWEESHLTGKWYLTNKGITEIHTLIRESIIFWTSILFGLIGALIGLIGVVIGLISVLKWR